MRIFDSPGRCVLVLLVKFRLVKSMNSNTQRRSLNLFEFRNSSFAFSFGFKVKTFFYIYTQPKNVQFNKKIFMSMIGIATQNDLSKITIQIL